MISCVKGFLDSSAGKESAYNAGDSSLIPGLGRSTGEGIIPWTIQSRIQLSLSLFTSQLTISILFSFVS